MMIEQGRGRGLARSDFGAGKLSRFTPAALGPNWERIHALAAYRLDAFLEAVKVPVTITSSYRSPAQNTAAAGASTSRHLPDSAGLSNAFDVWFRDPSFFTRDRVSEIIRHARAVGFNGVGFYKGKPLVHVDVRATPWSWIGEKVQLADGRQVMKFFPRDQLLDVIAGSAGVASVVALVALAILLARRSS